MLGKFNNFISLTIRMIACVFCFLLLQSCNIDSEDAIDAVSSKFTLGDNEFVIVRGETLTTTASQVSGTGSFVATVPLTSADSSSHFTFSGTLESSSVITIYAYGSNGNTQGLAVNFSNVSDALAVTLEFGDTNIDISDPFLDQNPEDISFGIDVHNDVTPARIVIWGEGETVYSPDRALFDSAGNIDFSGNGTSEYWGVILTDAVLTSVEQEESKLVEE